MLEEITKVMRRVFKLEEHYEIAPNATAKDIPAWDSLTQMNLVEALEEHFGVEFDFADLVKMDSAAAIAQVLQGKNTLK